MCVLAECGAGGWASEGEGQAGRAGHGLCRRVNTFHSASPSDHRAFALQLHHLWLRAGRGNNARQWDFDWNFSAFVWLNEARQSGVCIKAACVTTLLQYPPLFLRPQAASPKVLARRAAYIPYAANWVLKRPRINTPPEGNKINRSSQRWGLVSKKQRSTDRKRPENITTLFYRELPLRLILPSLSRKSTAPAYWHKLFEKPRGFCRATEKRQRQRGRKKRTRLGSRNSFEWEVKRCCGCLLGSIWQATARQVFSNCPLVQVAI
jgi:hypothetical protein